MAAAAQKTTQPPGELSGADRVAAILLTMGKPMAASLMKHFGPDEIKRVTRSAADLKPVSTARITDLVEDFATQFVVGANLVGDPERVERLLAEALPEDQVDEIMGGLHDKPEVPIWDRISELKDSELAAYLANEHPQTAALILSRVKSSCAAKVVTRLPPDRRDGIFRRMIAVKPIVDETMVLLEAILREEFTSNLTGNNDSESYARIAEIINKMDREQMDAVLENLEATQPQTARVLKSLMFTFEDLAKLKPSARAALMEKVPADKVVLALRGVDLEFREIVLSALSGRVRKMIEQELDGGQPALQRDVKDARRVVTDLALTMAAAGEIDIHGEDGEEEQYV